MRSVVKKFAEFFDVNGLVRHEFLPSEPQVLQRLRDTFRRKRRETCRGQWFLHDDNARSNTSIVVQQFLAEKNISAITQPSYYSVLAPSDPWLFRTLKMGLKETCFANMDNMNSNSTAELRKIPKNSLQLKLPKLAGSMERVCMCVFMSLCVGGGWLRASLLNSARCRMSHNKSAILPNSQNFLTAHRVLLHL
jgi:hypothetical protein